MIRLVQLLLLSTLVISSPTLAEEPEAVRAFLAKRQVVGLISFDEGSILLDATGQNEIARLIPLLQKLDADHVVIRIEGFATSTGTEPENVRISMQRAQAVADFLSPRLTNIFYITGCGSKHCGHSETDRARAEIVLYDNSLHLGTSPVEQVIQQSSAREG